MKKTLLFLTMLFGCLQMEAAPRFADVFSDDMVLQQKSLVRLWGYGDAGERIRIRVSWSAQRFATTVEADGRWEVKIPTPAASFDTHTVTLSGSRSKEIRLERVQIGEVWLCSGQSNMEMIMRPDSTWRLFVENAAEEIAAADYPHIRFLNVARNESFHPVEGLAGRT